MILFAALLLLQTTADGQPDYKPSTQHFGRWLLVEKKVSGFPMSPAARWEQQLYFHATDNADLTLTASGDYICAKSNDEKSTVTNNRCYGDFPKEGAEKQFLGQILMQSTSAEALSDMRANKEDFISAIKTMRRDAVLLYGGVHPSTTPCHGCVF